MAIAVPDGEIDILARKIDVMKSGADAQVDPGMALLWAFRHIKPPEER